MKTSIRSAVLAAALLLLPTSLMAQSNEHAEVDRAMQTLLRGFEAGDAKLLSGVLRKDGVVIGYSTNRGAVVMETTEEWANGFPGKPAPDEAQRHRQYQILDVTDSAAVVKLTLDYPTWDGSDYLALAKTDGNWMIVSKSWSGKRKTPAT